MSLKWREAATVILASLKTVKDGSFNYEVLSLKRSSKNSFMPGTHVFPGGGSHTADSSKKWSEILSKHEVSLANQLDDNVTPPILKESSELPKLITLKITAIREAFEETGILLCRRDKNSDEWASSLSNEELVSWRAKTQKDAFEFFNLCQHFDCYPDVNGLHLWSNWLTPKNNKKRFDTLFFLAALKTRPPSVADKSEIEDLTWWTPKTLLDRNENQLIILPPPQLYEISRLLNFKDLNDLVAFARDRALKGCERWMPAQFKSLDGTVSLLPGDDAYHVDTYDGINIPPPVIEMTADEFNSKSKVLHRFHRTKLIVKNYNPKNGHVLPVFP